MSYKRYILKWMVLSLGMASSACESPTRFPFDAPGLEPWPSPCNGDVPTSSPLGTGGDTYVYVISDITIDETPTDANAVQSGFNLDGIYTAEDGSTPFSCGKPDQPSDLDPEENRPGPAVNARTGRTGPTCLVGCRPGSGCRGGVDNQLPNVVDAVGTALSLGYPDGVRPVIRAQVREGKHPLVLVVSDVQSFDDDDSVVVRVFDGVQRFERQCDELVADREYAISASSTVNLDPDRSIYGVFRGSIRSGRLRTGGGFMPFFMPARDAGETFKFVMAEARLNVDLSINGGARGNAGGYVRGAELLSYARGLFRNIDWLQQRAAGIVGGYIDIEQPIPTAATMVSGLCADHSNPDMPRFGNIGVGFRFSLVRAQLAPGVVDGRAPGACGYVAPMMDAGVGDGGDASVVDVRAIDATTVDASAIDTGISDASDVTNEQ